MGHNDGIQSPSNPMPKHPHILKRDGRYYYQKRIPADLVRAGCYGKAAIIKQSLKTGDLTTASRLAMSVALEVDSDFDAKRREIGLASRFAKSAKSGESPAMRRLADISDIERRDFVIRQFIASEKLETFSPDFPATATAAWLTALENGGNGMSKRHLAPRPLAAPLERVAFTACGINGLLRHAPKAWTMAPASALADGHWRTHRKATAGTVSFPC